MHLPLLTLPFSLILLVAAAPLPDSTHYTEADIMQLRPSFKDELQVISHLGLKASSPSYQLAPTGDQHVIQQSNDGFALVPHQEFEKEKRRQLQRQHGVRHLAARLLTGSDMVLAAEEDPLDVRRKGLKPRYLLG